VPLRVWSYMCCHQYNSQPGALDVGQLNKQEGGMSFKSAELFPSSGDRQRTCHASPARRDHTRSGTVCASLFTPRVVLGAIIAPWSDRDAWCTNRGGLLANNGAERRAPLHPRPLGSELGDLIGPPGRSDFDGIARRALGAPGSPYGAGSRGSGRMT